MFARGATLVRICRDAAANAHFYAHYHALCVITVAIPVCLLAASQLSTHSSQVHSALFRAPGFQRLPGSLFASTPRTRLDLRFGYLSYDA